MRMGRHKPSHFRHSNHFQRLHEHSTRGAQRQDPDECGCNGAGWILSSCDVWEQCGIHYDGQPHPEDQISPQRETRHHELYIEKCRESRIDDPEEAQEAALAEKGDQDTEVDEDGGGLPFTEPPGDEGPDDPSDALDEEGRLPF